MAIQKGNRMRKNALLVIASFIVAINGYAESAANLSKKSISVDGLIYSFPICNDYAYLATTKNGNNKLQRVNLNTMTVETVLDSDENVIQKVDCNAIDNNFYALTKKGSKTTIAAYNNTNIKKSLWSHTSSSGEEYSDMAVGDDLAVLLVSKNDKIELRGFKTNNGKKSWVFKDLVFKGKLTIFKNRIFELNNYGNLFAYDLKTGAYLWAWLYLNAEIGSTINYDDASDTVIIKMSSSCKGLDAASGSMKWSFATDTSLSALTNVTMGDKFGVSSSLMVNDSNKTTYTYKLYQVQGNNYPLQRANLVFQVGDNLGMLTATAINGKNILTGFQSDEANQVLLYDDVGNLMDTLKLPATPKSFGFRFSEKPSEKWAAYSLSGNNSSEFGVLSWNK